MTINDTTDLGIGRRLHNLPALRFDHLVTQALLDSCHRPHCRLGSVRVPAERAAPTATQTSFAVPDGSEGSAGSEAKRKSNRPPSSTSTTATPTPSSMTD